MNGSPTLDRSFLAFAHPARRAIVARLALGPASVAEAAHGLELSKPAISKHLKLLEQAGVVSRTIEGRRHRLRLEPPRLAEAESWLGQHRRVWESKLDAVERYLEEQR